MEQASSLDHRLFLSGQPICANDVIVPHARSTTNTRASATMTGSCFDTIRQLCAFWRKDVAQIIGEKLLAAEKPQLFLDLRG
jgi:hypothetical protein